MKVFNLRADLGGHLRAISAVFIYTLAISAVAERVYDGSARFALAASRALIRMARRQMSAVSRKIETVRLRLPTDETCRRTRTEVAEGKLVLFCFNRFPQI
jgi:hypothetical protein